MWVSEVWVNEVTSSHSSFQIAHRPTFLYNESDMAVANFYYELEDSYIIMNIVGSSMSPRPF